ncbi:MAG: hypothetical protein M1831_000986 [Alyxoria varia]|nr:MAG: hypothetical protein M1831_000986 [Alyxoria varia]
MATEQQPCSYCGKLLPDAYYHHFEDISKRTKACTLCRVGKMLYNSGRFRDLHHQTMDDIKVDRLAVLTSHCDALMQAQQMSSAEKDQMMQAFQSSRAFTKPPNLASDPSPRRQVRVNSGQSATPAPSVPPIPQGYQTPPQPSLRRQTPPNLPAHLVSPRSQRRVQREVAEVATALSGPNRINKHTYHSIMGMTTHPAVESLKAMERQRKRTPGSGETASPEAIGDGGGDGDVGEARFRNPSFDFSDFNGDVNIDVGSGYGDFGFK